MSKMKWNCLKRLKEKNELKALTICKRKTASVMQKLRSYSSEQKEKKNQNLTIVLKRNFKSKFAFVSD